MTTRATLSFTAFASSALRVAFTPAQYVLTSVAFDGLEPASFEGDRRELARTIFGSVDVVPPLAREVLVQVKGARVGGTWLGALRLLHLALTTPLDTLAAGEAASALIVAPDMRLAKQGLSFALGAARENKAIKRRIRATNEHSFTLQRDDGRSVTIECLPATRGGSALRGRSLVGAMLTECAFFRDAAYVVNDAELFKAVAPRILKGGQVIIESTPFAEAGLLFDQFKANHGKPTTALAAHCPTLLMRPDARTAAIVDRERERDPDNAEREFGAVFMSAGSGLFFDAEAVDRCVVEGRVLPIAAPPGSPVACGADFGFRSDASAIAVVSNTAGRFDLLALGELRPSKGSPLKPSAVVASFATTARSYGCTFVLADQHYAESIREHLDEHKLTLQAAPDNQAGKATTYLLARKLINEGRLRLPPDRNLIDQLKAIISRPTSGGGLSISSPRRSGSHGDAVSALILALTAASRTASHVIVEIDPAGAITTHSGFYGSAPVPSLYGTNPRSGFFDDRPVINSSELSAYLQTLLAK